MQFFWQRCHSEVIGAFPQQGFPDMDVKWLAVGARTACTKCSLDIPFGAYLLFNFFFYTFLKLLFTIIFLTGILIVVNKFLTCQSGCKTISAFRLVSLF